MALKKGKFHAEINLIEKLLDELKLKSERNFNTTEIESHISELRHFDYKSMWTFYLDKFHYDFQLIDNSIIHFYFKKQKISFTFIACPFDCISYEDFLIEHDTTFSEVGESYYHDYELYLESCKLIESPPTFRYDYDPSSYNPGIHPASHIHIGIKNQIRIGLNYILNPLAFFFFILRQHYPNQWTTILEKKEHDDIIKNYKSKLDKIEKKYFSKRDSYDYYLV